MLERSYDPKLERERERYEERHMFGDNNQGNRRTAKVNLRVKETKFRVGYKILVLNFNITYN